MTYLYLMYKPSTGLFKIGVSDDLKTRRRGLKAVLIHVVEVADRSVAFRYETCIHNQFKAIGRWVTGEWFNLEEHWTQLFRDVKNEGDLNEFIEFQELAVKRWLGSGMQEIRNIQRALDAANDQIARQTAEIDGLKQQITDLEKHILTLEAQKLIVEKKTEVKIEELKEALKKESYETHLADKERLLREIGYLHYR